MCACVCGRVKGGSEHTNADTHKQQLLIERLIISKYFVSKSTCVLITHIYTHLASRPETCFDALYTHNRKLRFEFETLQHTPATRKPHDSSSNSSNSKAIQKLSD